MDRYTQVDIVSGFLGAGKTTLIKKLVSEGYGNDKLVLIENEFGKIGIDKIFVEKSGINVTEINSGCICCSLVGDFRRALKNVIKEYKPNNIIIEPSGVGKLSDIIKAIQDVGERTNIRLGAVATVLDVTKYNNYIENFGEFIIDQIRNSLVVILSKTQLIEDENIKLIIDSVKEYNNKAKIITDNWENIKVIDIFDSYSIESMIEEFENGLIEDHKHCSCTHEHHNHHAEKIFDSRGYITNKIFTKNKLLKILHKISSEQEYGLVLRAKGVVRSPEGYLEFDFVPGQINLRNSTYAKAGMLSIIGRDLQMEKIDKLWKLEPITRKDIMHT